MHPQRWYTTSTHIMPSSLDLMGNWLLLLANWYADLTYLCSLDGQPCTNLVCHFFVLFSNIDSRCHRRRMDLQRPIVVSLFYHCLVLRSQEVQVPFSHLFSWSSLRRLQFPVLLEADRASSEPDRGFRGAPNKSGEAAKIARICSHPRCRDP